MLKEIVNFSKDLEHFKIYENIKKKQQRLDKPILVIPISDDLTNIEIDSSYFVFRKIKFLNEENEGKYQVELDNMKEITLRNADALGFKINCIDNEPEHFKEKLLDFYNLTNKLPSDSKGNKSIGGNAGTNSYHLLAFEGKKETLFKDFPTFKKKMLHTYKTNVNKGIMENDEDAKEKWIKLFNLIAFEDNLSKIFNKIQFLQNNALQYNKNTEEWEKAFTRFAVIIKLSENNIKNNDIYFIWYENYLAKKVLKTEEDKYPQGVCSLCNQKDQDLWLPDIFQNLDSKKLFIRHIGRKNEFNIYVCKNCALDIFKFQNFFLNKFRISCFPLFTDKKMKKDEIVLIKKEEKVSFQKIIKDIYKKYSMDELDFYLIIYNSTTEIISFDYITGFQFYKNNMSVFYLERALNDIFFEGKLSSNYFTDKIDTGNKLLDLHLYNYRRQIFDYTYRAKYNALNNQIFTNLFFSILELKLFNFYNTDTNEISILKSIGRLYENYFLINKNFGGVFMSTIESIKQEKKVKDLNSMVYFSGQLVYYLLSLSEKDKRKHSMVEPFIKISNFKVFAQKLDELFSAYNHKIDLKNSEFNRLFSEVWGVLFDHQNEKFSKELKMLFYAGYFDSDKIL